MKIIADAHIPYIKEYFACHGELILISGREISHAAVKDADLLLVRSITRVDEKLLANTRVKFVGSVTAGHDHLDTDFLEEAGIKWCVASGFNAPPVADYVMSVIAALQKKERLLLSAPIRAAVIGMGNVGQLVAERLNLLQMDVNACDPFLVRKPEDTVFVKIEDITDVDLITLHVPLTRSGEHPTFHFIDQSFLKRQKPGCILLNASRGSVIDSNTLIRNGKLLHWCLDVFEHEPSVDKDIIQQSAIVTPHIAGYSVQSKVRGIDMIYREACKQKFIIAKKRAQIPMPRQTLTFSDGPHSWQDILLGIFNPLILTEMMRARLLPEDHSGKNFDQMRNEFNYRHEFAFTTVVTANVKAEEKQLLEKLGIIIL